MDFPRIKQFTFDIDRTYIVPDSKNGRADLIALDVYGNPTFYKPLCEANDIKLPYGLRIGLRPIEEALRTELKNTVFSKYQVSSTSTVNIPSLSGLLTIDGYLLQNEDLVLLKDQDNLEENGIYIALSGTWKKINDNIDTAFIIASNGFTNKNKGFRLKIIEKQDVGIDPIIFSGPFSILKVPKYTDQEIESAVQNYFVEKQSSDLDWNNYGDIFTGYVSGLYEGRILLVPTAESCLAWLKKFEKIIP